MSSLRVDGQYGPVFRLGHDYGTHHGDCEIAKDGSSDNCTCGFQAAFMDAEQYVRSLEEWLAQLLPAATALMKGRSMAIDVDAYVLQLEEPVRALAPLGRENVESILTACLDDVFGEDD